MDNITIRQANREDIDELMRIYDVARRYMRQTGNLTQWINGYPSRYQVLSDVTQGVGYVGEDRAGHIVMAFAFIIGSDPTYSYIEDGRWLNDLPYGTIHRLGSDGSHAGVLRRCVEFCFSKINNLRLDTHADNAPMRAAAGRLGFTRCGVIYCDDGSPRIAYQKSLLTLGEADLINIC